MADSWSLVLGAFAVVFVSLQVWSYTRTSATFDEPGSLAAGYAALTSRDYRPAIEHPPFTRVWAALPLLTMPGVSFDTKPRSIGAGRKRWHFRARSTIGHRFLYKENDADRLLYRARFMNVLLGVVLGLLLFCWVGEWLGFRAAVVALGLYTIEPNIAAHSSLVTTDLGVSCFMFGAIYFLWRISRQLTVSNIAGLVVCFVLAMLSKFSAAILGPVILVLLAMIAWRRGTLSAAGGGWRRRAARRGHVARRLGGLWIPLRSERDAGLAVRAARSPGRAAGRSDDRRARRLD